MVLGSVFKELQVIAFSRNASLHSWRDFAREWFYFGTEAQPCSQGRVEFRPAKIRGFFFNYAFTRAREFRIG